MIVLRAIKARAIVVGGGAVEMELSRFMKEHLMSVKGKH
jgi:T-complex protein 1 subunit eta